MKSASSTSASFDSPTQLLKHFERNAKFEYGVSTLLGLIQVGFTIAFAWQVAMMLDLAIYQTNRPTQLPDSTDWLILVFVLAGRSAASAIQSRMGNQASIKVRSALRSFALKRCFELNIRLFPVFTATEASNLLVTEIDRQRGYFADFIAQKNLSVLMPLAIIIASATVSWLVPLIFLFTAPLVPLFMVLVGSRAAEISRVNLTELNRLGDLLTDRLKNLQALQLAGTTQTEGDRLFDQSEHYRTSTMKVLRLSFLSGTLLEFFSAISVAIVAVYLGLFFLNKYDFGSYASGYGLFEGIFLLILAPEFYLPLRRLGALYHDKMDASSTAEHLLKLDRLYQQECTSLTSPVENQGSENSALTSQIKQPPLEQLSVDHLQSGSSGVPVHFPVSFSIQPGQRLLLNGPSGVGKTTLLDTLAGLRQPPSGSISVNGKPVALFHQSGWFRQIGYLSQRPELLFASVRENLELGIAFTDEALFSALEQARAAGLVRSLPGGLDYQISDDGGYLSGGQAQRIALARVFLHRPALLLLDEPTANLDEATAQEFMQQLLHYSDQGGMLIMASHRPGERVVFHQQIDMRRATAAENANPGAITGTNPSTNPETNKPTGDAQ